MVNHRFAMRRRLLSLPALSLLPQMQAGATDAFPNKLIRIIVTNSSGSAIDVQARQMAPLLEAELRQTVMVDNQTGSGGLIGINQLLKAPRDGHTLAIASSTYSIAPSLYKLPYDTGKDIEPITILTTAPLALVVNTKLGVNSLSELVQFARSRPANAAVTFGSSGVGTTTHLAEELLAKQLGIRFLHVPYKGQNQYTNDMIGGIVDAGFLSLVSTVPYVKAGKLKAIAISGGTRTPLFPDVPTVAESGFPDYDVEAWVALIAASGTPRPVMQKLNDVVTKVMRSKEMASIVGGERGGEVVASSLKDAQNLVMRDIARFEGVIKSLGIKPL